MLVKCQLHTQTRIALEVMRATAVSMRLLTPFPYKIIIMLGCAHGLQCKWVVLIGVANK